MAEKAELEKLILLREAVGDDRNLVFSATLKALYFGCPYFREIEQDDFFKSYQQVLYMLLAKPSTVVVTACLKDSPNTVIGFLILSHDCVHFAYVKKKWRREGIMNFMLDGLEIKKVSHITKIGNAIRRKKGWDFSPFGII